MSESSYVHNVPASIQNLNQRGPKARGCPRKYEGETLGVISPLWLV